MSKLRLSHEDYLYALHRALEVWIAVEKSGDAVGDTRIPTAALAVLLDALHLIALRAKHGEHVRVFASARHVRVWLHDHEVEYRNERDLLGQLRARLAADNDRGRESRRLLGVFPKQHPWTHFGAHVQVLRVPPHTRIEAWLTAGSQQTQERVEWDGPTAGVPLAELSSGSPQNDPEEVALWLGLASHYYRRGDTARYTHIVREARRNGVQLPTIRARTLQLIAEILRRRYRRRFGSLDVADLSDVQRVALEKWYQWALLRWESAEWEQTLETAGALARTVGHGEAPEHPDELLAAAAKREHVAALQQWALARVSQSKTEVDEWTAMLERAAKVTSPPLEGILRQLEELGIIDDVEGWLDEQLASDEVVESEAGRVAAERRMPPPMVQRAVRRLARPRLQSWPEREARKIAARTPSSTAEELLVKVVKQYLQLLDVPRLDGRLELYLERQLRLFCAIHRLVVAANDAA
ncbi:MAG TPA: hypothetical protein VEK11_00915 [Thermoanaerobaculia bacterium]|nr:hypothetical protein [Thermoanaerobaculia bacterium]